MITQSTKGVKISVRTNYQGSFYQKSNIRHAFAYRITITNNSLLPIQVDSRYWKITDSLQSTQIVQGPGIVGQQPVIEPGASHSYSSGCVLDSTIGAMQGYYNVISPIDNTEFRVEIPRFRLVATYAMN